MGYRRKARECALQMLYELDMTDGDPASVRKAYWGDNQVPEAVRDYADRLLLGAEEHRADIDRHIEASSQNWRIERMGRVDRNILRMGVYELLFERDTPEPVVIDEAIEIAKKYSTEDAAHFVNGVLDAVRKTQTGNRETRRDPAG